MKYFLIVILFFGFSCKKDKSCEDCVNGEVYKEATVEYQGPVETDGCGWLIKTDDTHTYRPDVLNVSFQQNKLHVKIAYEATTDTFICGVAGLHIPIIHVIDIKL